MPLNNPQQDVKYLDDLMTLVERINTASAAPYLYAHERDFFEKNLCGATYNVLAFEGQQLIGYAALRGMQPWPDYLNEYNYYQPEQCALMLYNLVDPNCRGKGVGKQLAQARIELAKQLGLKHLLVTVHPDNHATVHILEQSGFELIAQKPMFSQQLLRNLMHLAL